MLLALQLLMLFASLQLWLSDPRTPRGVGRWPLPDDVMSKPIRSGLLSNAPGSRTPQEATDIQSIPTRASIRFTVSILLSSQRHRYLRTGAVQRWLV